MFDFFFSFFPSSSGYRIDKQMLCDIALSTLYDMVKKIVDKSSVR